MTCHFCEKPNNPRYFFCYGCYLKKKCGLIIKCSVCGQWRFGSKHDERCCPDCFVYTRNKKKAKLPSDPYDVFKVKNDSSNTHLDSSSITGKLIEIHKKHKHQYTDNKNNFDTIRRLNDSVKKRELKTQKFCSSWSDNNFH
jgi:hypothetical protein